MKSQLVKYPIGIQSFSNIRNGGYVYVDKTAIIHRLVENGQYYFLSRPRRFGKSLLLSTIQAYFEGRKELFDGLAIAQPETEWKRHPVLLLSLARYNPDQFESLEAIIVDMMRVWEKEYDVSEIPENLSARFANIIRSAYAKTGRQVVILIDEYDAPLVAHLGDDHKHERIRNVLKSIYVNIKDMSDYIRFALLTGVSRFSKMTIFSGLNNLDDISLQSDYSDICGITEAELRRDFQPGLNRLAKEWNTDCENVISILKDNYDGYHFAKNSADIFNPFSLLKAFKTREISAYWFQSGTPTVLIQRLKNEQKPLAELLNDQVSETSISDIDTYRTNPLSLLFQTGYLTIKSYDSVDQTYRLGIPNREVEKGLFTELLANNTDTDKIDLDKQLLNIRKSFNSGNPDNALSFIKSFFAGIPANITQNKPEVYFENNLYLLLKLIGMEVQAEQWTSNGRIDLLLKTTCYIYIIELKLDGSAEQALAQIDSKEYALPWRFDGRKVYKIGVNFLKSTRNIDSWTIS